MYVIFAVLKIDRTEFIGRTLTVRESGLKLIKKYMTMLCIMYSNVLFIGSQGLQLMTRSGDLPENLISAISLEQEIVNSIQEQSSVSIAFTVYDSTALFPVRNTLQNEVALDTIVGSQVLSVQVGGIADRTRLSAPVTFSQRLTKSSNLAADQFAANRSCVFWDFKAAGRL